MVFKNKSKFLKYIVPLSFSTFFVIFFMQKNNTNYVSDQFEILSDMEIERNKKKSLAITKFELKPFIPDNKYEPKSSLSVLNNNPFDDLGTIESSYNQLPSDLKFTGILKIGDKEGVFVSSTQGLDVFYSGQEITKGYKIISIDSEKAEIIVTNGLNTKLVKLEQD